MRWPHFRDNATLAPGAKPEKGKAPAVVPGFRLNLLTTDQKLALRKHLLFLTLRDGLFILLIEAAIFGSILLASRFILDNTYRDAVEQSVRITRTFSGNNQQIKAINDDLIALEGVATKFIPAGDLFGNIMALTPPGITISSLTFDVTGERFRMRGVARRREDLTKLQDALFASTILRGIEAPLSNLFVKQDIPFEFSAGLVTKDMPRPIFIAPPDASNATSTQSV